MTRHIWFYGTAQRSGRQNDMVLRLRTDKKTESKNSYSRHLKPPLARQNTYVITPKQAILVILSRPLAWLAEGSENGKKRFNSLK